MRDNKCRNALGYIARTGGMSQIQEDNFTGIQSLYHYDRPGKLLQDISLFI